MSRPTRLGAGVAGAAALIAAVTLASRFVGFGRWLVQASEVGPNALGAAYTSANTLPNVLFEVVAGGALAGAAVPLLAVPLARAIRSDVDRIASALLGWALAVLVPLGVVVVVLARPLMRLFLPAGSEAQIDVGAGFLLAFAAQIPLYGLAVVLAGVLQAHRRFLGAALAPLLSSVVVIGVYVAFGLLSPGSNDDPSAVPEGALAVLGWGTTVGVAVLGLPLLVPVRRLGVRLRPTLRFPPGVAGRARALAVAGVGALVAQQASILVTMRLANDNGASGTFPVFLYTQAVYLLPYAVLAYPLATATFPRLAETAARKDRVGFAALVSTSTRTLLVLAVLGAAALVAAAPAVEAAFVAFADGDVTGMGTALTWMAPGLLGYALILHLSRALYALDRGRAAVTATAAGWLAVIGAQVLAVRLLTPAGGAQAPTLRGLAIGTSVGMAVAGVALLAAVVRAVGTGALRGVARTAAGLVVGGTAGALAGRWMADAVLGPGIAGALVAGAAGGAVAAVVVLGTAWVTDRGALRTTRGTADAPDAPDGRGEVTNPSDAAGPARPASRPRGLG